jgi:hypothetical protein
MPVGLLSKNENGVRYSVCIVCFTPPFVLQRGGIVTVPRHAIKKMTDGIKLFIAIGQQIHLLPELSPLTRSCTYQPMCLRAVRHQDIHRKTHNVLSGGYPSGFGLR